MREFVLSFYILVITGTFGIIINRPMNVAVGIGGTTYFNCTCDNSNFKWVYSKDGSLTGNDVAEVTDRSCVVLSNFTSNFRTEKTGNTCNLVVVNAKTSLGGYYHCYQDTGANKSNQAVLIVVDENPIIGHNGTDAILSGENVIISVSVQYGGPSKDPPVLAPSFNWTLASDPSKPLQSSSKATNSNSSSWIVVTAEPPAIPSYFCTLFFNSPVHSPTCSNCATNAPNYTITWSTNSISLSYPASNLTLTVDLKMPCLENTMQLHCSALGYPPPTYTWTNVTDGRIISNTGQVTIKYGQGGIYRCNATNMIRNIIYTEFQDINTTDCIPPKEILITTDGEPCSDTCRCDNCTSINLNCHTEALPGAEYQWTCDGDEGSSSAVITVTKSSECTCKAYNFFNGTEHSTSKSVTLVFLLVIPEPLICEKLGMPDDACIVILVIVSIVSLNIFFTFVFLLLYGLNEDFRKTLNERFEWMDEVMPCFNKGCECSAWVIVFIAITIAMGFIEFPVLIMMAYCSCCNKDRFKDKSNHPNASASEYTDVMSVDPPQGAYESLRWPNPELSTGQGALVYEELTTKSGDLQRSYS